MELKTLYFNFDWLLQNEPFSLFYLKETTNYRIYMYLNAGFLVRWLMRNWSHRKYYALLDCTNVAAVGSLQTESTVLFRKKYREYNERVQTVIPKERLLVYNVKQGWEPLCMFLGCEVPQESFPWANRGQGGTLQTLAQRKQELAVKVVKVFVIFMGLFVHFFSRFAIWSFDATCSFRVYDNPCLILSAYGKQIH